ncbi:MAG: iron ABC transporter permease, partial [Candidatus Devosia euplotis]|nr:iron ABC transporter permease [Candidatus Devosia euplotis]
MLALGFGIPVGQLSYLAFRVILPETASMTVNDLIPTLILASLGALTTVIIGLVAAKLAQRFGRLATLGYAIPGTVLALGLLQPLGQADLRFNRMTTALAGWRPGLILSGSMAALLYVYAIRFLAVSHSTLDAAI